jgi:hypothetical protein
MELVNHDNNLHDIFSKWKLYMYYRECGIADVSAVGFMDASDPLKLYADINRFYDSRVTYEHMDKRYKRCYMFNGENQELKDRQISHLVDKYGLKLHKVSFDEYLPNELLSGEIVKSLIIINMDELEIGSLIGLSHILVLLDNVRHQNIVILMQKSKEIDPCFTGSQRVDGVVEY